MITPRFTALIPAFALSFLMAFPDSVLATDASPKGEKAVQTEKKSKHKREKSNQVDASVVKKSKTDDDLEEVKKTSQAKAIEKAAGKRKTKSGCLACLFTSAKLAAEALEEADELADDARKVAGAARKMGEAKTTEERIDALAEMTEHAADLLENVDDMKDIGEEAIKEGKKNGKAMAEKVKKAKDRLAAAEGEGDEVEEEIVEKKAKKSKRKAKAHADSPADV
ncbi:MAG: hypothetical protein ACK5O7_02475 [Holosporales bacterium]